MKPLSKNEKLLISILIGWTLLQIVFFFISIDWHNTSGASQFYPFTDEKLQYTYNYQELLTYSIIPSVVFFAYRFMNFE